MIPANDDAPAAARGLSLAAWALAEAIERRLGRLPDADPAVIEAARALIVEFDVDPATARAALAVLGRFDA
jgi:hypothetical protein